MCPQCPGSIPGAPMKPSKPTSQSPGKCWTRHNQLYIYICVLYIYIYCIYIYNDNGSSPIKPPFVCRSRFLNATAFIRLGYILYLQRIKHVNGKYQMYPHVYRNLYWMNLSKLYPCTNPVCKVCSHVFPFTKKHCVSFITTWFWPRKSSRLPRPCHLALGPRPEVF